MPYGPYADLLGTVTNTMAVAADLVGTVLEGDRGPTDLTGTVSLALVNSWDGASIFVRPRIKVAGVWLDEHEFEAPVIDDPAIESHTGGFSFTVHGRNWGIWRTEKVFSRGTEVGIYLDHGIEGAVIEPTTPDYTGYVIGCDQRGGVGEPVVTVRCGDAAALWEKCDACEEVAPGADYTRGQIVRLLCDAAGIPAVSCPDGATYTKGLQAVNKRLFEVIKGLIEPEGWALRFTSDGTLDVWKPAIKLPPLAPDFTWTRADLLEPPTAIPPEDSPSRWVVTGNTLKEVDESGAVTTTTTTLIEGLYAPKVATQQQQLDGSVTSTGIIPNDETFQPISKIEETVVKLGDRVIQQRVKQWGWKNLERAGRHSIGASGGTASGGYSYDTVLIDEDGKFVAWFAEKFIPLSERIETYNYDTLGTLTGTVATTYTYGKRTEGVRGVSTDPDATTVLNAYVYSDDQTYTEPIEQYFATEQVTLAYAYGDDGALQSTTQNTYRYYSPKTRIDGPTVGGGFYYQLGDGTGQYDLVAVWTLWETKVETQILKDGQVQGTQTVTYTYAAAKKADGIYDWGNFHSNAEIETFQLTRVDIKQYNIISESMYEEVTYPAEGGRTSRVFLGRLPTTRYTASTWTSMVTQPIEARLDDDTALAWFGFSREAFTQDYVLSTDEALTVIANRRRRTMCRKLEVVRPDTAAKVGDTIRYISPEDGVNGLFMVTAKRRDWTGIMPRATLRLEEWSE